MDEGDGGEQWLVSLYDSVHSFDDSIKSSNIDPMKTYLEGIEGLGIELQKFGDKNIEGGITSKNIIRRSRRSNSS